MLRHLEADLVLLSAECKRRNSNIRTECDTAIALLKSYAPGAALDTVSDAHRRQVAAPLVSTLASNNTKLVAIAILAINRLVGTTAVSEGSLGPLLDGFLEASLLATDIQLRILQCLPPLMQNYMLYVHGSLLVRVLRIACGLTAANKPAVVINTASATLQQIFCYIYERNEKLGQPVLDTETPQTPRQVKLADKTVFVDELSYEGYLIFLDLCSIVNDSKTAFLTENIPLKPLAALELIHTVMQTQRNLFLSRPDLQFLAGDHLVPSLLRILNHPTKSFAYYVRCLRVVQCILTHYVAVLPLESEVLFLFLNHLLLDDENIPQDWAAKSFLWDKILVLEVLLEIFSSFSAVLTVYDTFDANTSKKNVLLELLSTLEVFVSHNSYLVLPTIQPTAPSMLPADYLSSKTSTLRVALLDSLDKSEPPSAIPRTYAIFLAYSTMLAYLDGVVKYVSRLGSDSSDSQLDFITTCVRAGHQHLFAMFRIYAYTMMDNETFHVLLRTMQKYIHSTGLLGLTAERDQMLAMLAVAVVESKKDKAQEDEKAEKDGADEARTSKSSNSTASSLHDQGKQLLNYGESLVGSLASSLTQSGDELAPRSYREFNSRQVVCLRALINLAISLGSTLEGSWDILNTTFQWCDYFLHGADEFSLSIKSDRESKRGSVQRLEHMPQISIQEMNAIHSLKEKLLASFGDYPEDALAAVLESLIRLSSVLFGRNPPHQTSAGPLSVCPYNKLYFFNQVEEVSRVNAARFATDSSALWNTVSTYISDLGNDRSLHYNLRVHIVDSLNAVVRLVAEGGFAVDQPETTKNTAHLTLDCLLGFLDSMFAPGTSREMLVVNCETEIHLKVLATVHGLIDKYDSLYQDAWKQVFSIINTPFVSAAAAETRDSNLRDKMAQVVNFAFETLKLILDEFLDTLPPSQLKMVTDTLYNFSEQHYDLNILFSSVSCFWLVGDSVRAKIEAKDDKGENDPGLQQTFETVEQLALYVSQTSDTKLYFMSMDVYLLQVLARVCGDKRARVRDGAIQTLFQIIDVHASSNFDWDSVYRVALPPLLSVEIAPQEPAFNKAEWLESLGLTFAGLEDVFGKFVPTTAESEFYWEGLLGYFSRLLTLRWVDLDVKIVKSFDELLSQLLKQKSVSPGLKNLFYEFWVSVSIEYDFINPLYQDFLVSFCQSYLRLNELVGDIVDGEQIARVLHALGHCARYPVLPHRASDEEKPSKLQAAVLDNLEKIHTHNPQVASAVVQQLATMVVFPFGVKSRIEQRVAGKLNGTANLPTFHALSRRSMGLLRAKLSALQDLSPLVQDGGMLRVLRSLLEMIRQKPAFLGDKLQAPIWLEAEDTVQYLTTRLMADQGAMLDKSSQSEAYWKTVLDTLTICFEVADSQHEASAMAQYKLLSREIFPVLLGKEDRAEKLFSDFLARVFEELYLYELNDIESGLEDQNASAYSAEGLSAFTRKLCCYDFDASVGTTAHIVPFSDSQIRLMCLAELCSFAAKNHKTAIEMLVCRASFCLRRFVADARLLYRAPLPRIQQRELVVILRALPPVIKAAQSAAFAPLQPLLVQSIPYASRVDGLATMLQLVLQEVS